MVPRAATTRSVHLADTRGEKERKAVFPKSLPLPEVSDRDSYASTAFADITDRSYHAALARVSRGISPAAVGQAYLDWWTHLAFAPGKRMQLAEKAAKKALRFANHAANATLSGNTAEPCIAPLPQDHRFDALQWQRWPYNLIYQSFLLNQQWWHNATHGVRGVTRKHEDIVAFVTRQMLDVFAPSNFLLTNPVALERTLKSGGANLIKGWANFLQDLERVSGAKKPAGAETYAVGRDVAVTPGRVVYRNRLIELIQYTPTTDTVHAEPVLIVPAWIMKYYILDLRPENSLVKFLTDQGFTVFMVSWRNPGYDDRDLGMDDYRKLGVMAALETVNAVVPNQKVHAVGYCLGGTLLSIAAAAMARDGDERLKTLSFLAAQTDFEEAGELTLFVVESQIAFLEAMMREQGFLDVHQMAGAFQMLHSNDLVWSRVIHDYLMGERTPMNDLMAWNADGTRMPARMHSEYLRQLFLKNDLAEGRFKLEGRAIALTDIDAPLFAVGTETDHVAPWRSVYKFHLLTDTDVTFLLTNGGHNGGIVSEPGRQGRRYRLRTRKEHDRYIDPETWLEETPVQDGSWWPAWGRWLAERSGGRVAARHPGSSLTDAPGSYVLQH